MLNIIIFIVLAYTQANNTQQNTTQINNTSFEAFKLLRVGSKNISLIIVENPRILLIFYSNFCTYSYQFVVNEFDNIKRDADQQNIMIGIYDTQQNDIGIFNKYGIVETPTITFFQDEVQYIYTGIKKSHLISKWIFQLSNDNPPPKEIFSQQEFNDLQKENKNVLFYQRNTSKEFDTNFDIFYQVAKSNTNPELVFAYSQQYKQNNLFSLNFYKKESWEEIEFNFLFSIESIGKFILKNLLPQVPQLNSESEVLVFQASSLSFILFYGLDELSKSAESAFIEVSNSFKKIYQFSKINIQDEQYLDYIIDLGFNDGIIPKIVALNGKFKYKYDDSDFSVNGIKQFIYNLRKGQINQQYLSEPVSTYYNTDSYVKNIAGVNYDQEIKKNTKYILLKYYVKGCQACEELQPIYEQLAQHYKENNALIIAQIDIRLNDFTDTYYPRQVPDIILFLHKNGKREAIFWDQQEMTYDNILKFVEGNIHKKKK